MGSSGDDSDMAGSSDSSEDDLMEVGASDGTFLQSLQTFVLAADYMGMLDTQPVRAARRWQVKRDRKHTDM